MREVLPPYSLYLLMRGGNAFAFGLILTYELVYHTAIVGLNPLQLVLVGVVLETMTVLFEIPTGIVADLYSRRLAVVIGMLLTGAGFLLETLLPIFAVVLLAQVVWGIGFTFYSGAESAWIVDEIGTDRAQDAFLRATQVAQLAAIAGTFLGALLARASVTLPIVLGAASLLALGGVLATIMPETGFRPAPRVEGQHIVAHLGDPLRRSARLVRVHPLLWMIMLLGALIGLALGGFDRLYAQHFLNNVTVPFAGQITPVVWLGLLSGIVSVGSLIGTEIVRRRNRTIDQAAIIRLLLGMHGGILVGSLFFAATGGFALAVLGFCLVQILRNISRPLLLLWINQNAESQVRATVISTYWQANALGQIAGSPVLGWIGTTASLWWALRVGSLFYSVTLPLLLFAQRRWNRVQGAQPAPQSAL